MEETVSHAPPPPQALAEEIPEDHKVLWRCDDKSRRVRFHGDLPDIEDARSPAAAEATREVWRRANAIRANWSEDERIKRTRLSDHTIPRHLAEALAS